MAPHSCRPAHPIYRAQPLFPPFSKEWNEMKQKGLCVENSSGGDGVVYLGRFFPPPPLVIFSFPLLTERIRRFWLGFGSRFAQFSRKKKEKKTHITLFGT